jgi:hypothetical protein
LPRSMRDCAPARQSRPSQHGRAITTDTPCSLRRRSAVRTSSGVRLPSRDRCRLCAHTRVTHVAVCACVTHVTCVRSGDGHGIAKRQSPRPIVRGEGANRKHAEHGQRARRAGGVPGVCSQEGAGEFGAGSSKCGDGGGCVHRQISGGLVEVEGDGDVVEETRQFLQHLRTRYSADAVAQRARQSLNREVRFMKKCFRPDKPTAFQRMLVRPSLGMRKWIFIPCHPKPDLQLRISFPWRRLSGLYRRHSVKTLF